jgi:hypothetical protein
MAFTIGNVDPPRDHTTEAGRVFDNGKRIEKARGKLREDSVKSF